MARLSHPLLRILANSTHRKMAAQIQYLKAENEILRARLPKQIRLKPKEKSRLVKLGDRVGPALKELISVVAYRSWQRWSAEARAQRAAKKKAPSKRKPGRPRTDEDIRELVIRIATEMDCGYTRVLGELKKLGITLGRTTVRRIMLEAGLDPNPRTGKGSWDEFLKIHAETLWACDFLSKKVFTLRGWVDYYLLVFINIKTRQVIASPVTAHPDADWVAQQGRNLLMEVEERGMRIRHLIRDCDTKFTAEFDALLKTDDVEIHRVGPRKPNLNAYAERFIQSIQQECLDHFVVLGEKHLSYIVAEYLDHYQLDRPHQGLGNAAPVGCGPPGSEAVVCEHRLGGLLKSYRRAA